MLRARHSRPCPILPLQCLLLLRACVIATCSSEKDLLVAAASTPAVISSGSLPGGSGTPAPAPQGFMHSWDPQQRAEHCEREYKPLFAAIEADLKPWRNANGITVELMEATISRHTTRSHTSTRKGFLLGFRNGTPMLPDMIRKLSRKNSIRQHADLFKLYMTAMLEVQQLFGDLIPDVDIVISTIDRPLVLPLLDNATTPEPVMRFCKSPAHTDILIPNFHFYSPWHNNQLFSAQAQEAINAQYPWKTRKPILFGRFSPYYRHMHKDDPHTWRVGVGGLTICRNASAKYGAGAECPVRSHFMSWAEQHKPLIDVGTGKVLMADHARYKYLLHLDGQGLSSRLDQLVNLGSLIFKEESGYYAYYHHLLKPYEHYVPFWKQGNGPEDILEVIKWAEVHDEQAERIGRAAQELAAKYLSSEARACYWYKLLTEYAKLLRYKPSDMTGRKYWDFNWPVAKWLSKHKTPTTPS